jgi:aspartate/methionine/tyrosine aminotransferase
VKLTMTKHHTAGNLPACFSLKTVKAAKVSEISEAVSSSELPIEERVNFHIGNPAGDLQLNSIFREILFQGEEKEIEKEHLDLIEKAAKKSVPYAPRGGFQARKPSTLAEKADNWFCIHQEEPLAYSLGAKEGKRELIFQSGGKWESLRVFFRSASRYLKKLPARIALFECELPSHLEQHEGLDFLKHETKNESLLQWLEGVLEGDKNCPTFLLLGRTLDDQERREVRRICLRSNLMIIEVNNCKNHDSIARESGLMHRVIRFIELRSLSPLLSNSPLVITAGNADFLEIMEAVHFELKGTPPVAEMVLASWLLDQKDSTGQKENWNPVQEIENKPQELFASGKLDSCQKMLSSHLEKLDERLAAFSTKISGSEILDTSIHDEFELDSPAEIITSFFQHIGEKELGQEIEDAFLSSFSKVFPRYKAEHCLVVSGSARTALSLLGFNCGIDEVITPDLGWTYAHCFPRVTHVPLEADLGLDVEAILGEVDNKLENDSAWRKVGAVVLNSPHNASGKVYSMEKLKCLLKELLGRRIMVLDDLSYENIHPRSDLKGSPTMRQIVNDMVASGELKQEHGDYLVTIHSLSKTDCFAGGRLAVAEIRLPALKARFSRVLGYVQPNLFSLLIAYLFYRNGREEVEKFWLGRNMVFQKRMKALLDSLEELPTERNPYKLNIVEPQGSMYPRLEIRDLPDGLSLDWLSTNLATQGVGLVPLATFSKTERGYDLARKSFRLSLGGDDSHLVLKGKMRRTLINLNRLIAHEAAQYTKHCLPALPEKESGNSLAQQLGRRLQQGVEQAWQKQPKDQYNKGNSLCNWREFNKHAKERIAWLVIQLEERLSLKREILSGINSKRHQIAKHLEKEFYKDEFEERLGRFKKRLYDRTVHPTQMFSLKADCLMQEISDELFYANTISQKKISDCAVELLEEYKGRSVAISSRGESDEVLSDIFSLVRAVEWARVKCGSDIFAFLSFWSDWDGSTRPSGQGHRLVASVLQENIEDMANLLEALEEKAPEFKLDKNLAGEIRDYRKQSKRFRELLEEITELTNILEKRYKGLLPAGLRPGFFRGIGMKLGISSDPIESLLEHNNRLERRMNKLKQSRRQKLEYFFSVNKKLRKELFSRIDDIVQKVNDSGLLLRLSCFHDRIKRFVLTPRIHQKIILDNDSFTIDRTVENIMEINEVAARYGNPGMVLALQVSMSTDPEALIHLDRKFLAEKRRRELEHGARLPDIHLVPLFEEIDAVENLESYLDRIWKYCQSSRGMDESTGKRFSRMMCEIFIAGSDLSQQLGQVLGGELYKQAKLTTMKWAAEKGLAHEIRVKLGSGEPMQRQGGYYDPGSGAAALDQSLESYSKSRLYHQINKSAVKALAYAKSPLAGFMAGGEFRTLQSNVSEKFRHISHSALANAIYHMQESQRKSEDAMIRTASTMVNTRLNRTTQERKELQRSILGNRTSIYEEFVRLNSRYFRNILYGLPEDLVGIHVISYFISRTTPPLRDRPVVRPSKHTGLNRSLQVVGQLQSVVPLSENGSMLRAIGHNRAQTAVLGINQLTTGLFRALSEIRGKFSSSEEGNMMISDRILPSLAVKEILSTLRIYQDSKLETISRMEELFPAGCTSFHLLREDSLALSRFLPLFQEELLRKQGLKPQDFFSDGVFRQELLPLFRPDLAVLLQNDLFNRSYEKLEKQIAVKVSEQWQGEVKRLLQLPKQIEERRLQIWDLIETPLKKQVRSFVKVASAVSQITAGDLREMPKASDYPAIKDLSARVNRSLKGEKDESLKHFLAATVDYLSGLAAGDGMLPVEAIRVLKDVDQILNIEAQALDTKQQQEFNFLLLSIARLAGENG